MGYPEILEAVKQMTEQDIEKLKNELDTLLNIKSNNTLEEEEYKKLLLNGPTMTDEEYEEYLKNRKHFDAWSGK